MGRAGSGVSFLFSTVAVSGVAVIARGVPFTRRNRFVLTAGLTIGYGATLVPTYFNNVFTYDSDSTSLRGFLDAIKIIMSTEFVVTAFMTMFLNQILQEEIEDEVSEIDAQEEGSLVGQESNKESERAKEA